MDTINHLSIKLIIATYSLFNWFLCPNQMLIIKGIEVVIFFYKIRYVFYKTYQRGKRNSRKVREGVIVFIERQ